MLDIHSNHLRKKGFTLIESMVVLFLLSLVIITTISTIRVVQAHTEAKRLAEQTTTFAKIFASYINNNYSAIESNIQSTNNLVFSPTDLIASNNWKANTSTVNLYNQIPCITLRKNPHSNDIEAIMFYTSTNSDKSIFKLATIRKASLFIGSSGGIISNNSVIGNAGWSTTTSSEFFTNISKCGGGVIPKYSLVVNIDMMPEWNQDLQQEQMLRKVNDDDTPLGNLANTNTAKSNIYLANNKGVILDNTTPNNPVKLKIVDNGQQTGSAMLSLSSQSTNLAMNTIQVSKTILAGTTCTPSEIGKTSVNGGASTLSNLNVYLSKNTLVCSLNKALCTNSSNTCYLPSTANEITFRNTNNGIQNGSGIFICPSTIPYLDEKSVHVPTITLNLNTYTENLSYFQQPKIFVTQGCNPFSKKCDSVDFKSSGISPTGYDPEIFSIPVTFIHGYVNNYEVSRGFNSLSTTPTINYKAYLDKSGQCNNSIGVYGVFTSKFDNKLYHYRACLTWWLRNPSQMIAIKDVGNIGILNVQYATCSNGAEYSINYN